MQKKRLKLNRIITGTQETPRASVFRSNLGIYVQLIDDTTGKTILSASPKDVKSGNPPAGGPTEKAKEIGKELAVRAKSKKIESIKFDRNGYRYHGRVKALAEGMREGGLKF